LPGRITAEKYLRTLTAVLKIDSGNNGMHNKLAATLVIGALVLIFVFQNTAAVKIQFLFWSMTMSRSLLILVFVGLGILIGWLLKSYVSFRHRHR